MNDRQKVIKTKMKKKLLMKTELDGVLKADQLSVSDDSVLREQECSSERKFDKHIVTFTKNSIWKRKQAVSEGKSVKVERKVNEISLFLTHLKENNIDYECDGPKAKIYIKTYPRNKKFY